MNNIFTRFSLRIIILLGIAFALHLFILSTQNLPLYDNKIILSYVINTVLAIVIFLVLYLLRKKFKSQMGFLFMGGSAIKFIVFFIVFQPIYKADGDITTLEFLAFFIPYLLCLLVETFSLGKWLNKLE